MEIKGLYSLRGYLKENFRDTVYEWEDDINNILFCGNGIELVEYQRFEKIRKKIVSQLSFGQSRKNANRMAFCMNIYELNDYYGYLFPIIIDLWPKDKEKAIRKIGKRVAIVTSIDMYKALCNNCPNIVYMPLSISDRWVNERIPIKENIIVQMGRNNPLLHKYAINYCKKNPEIEYLYAEYNQDTKRLTYYSTVKGLVNTPETREEYMSVLRNAKICLLSSPGIDNTRPMAEGIDYPTPRFYETAINYCHMLGRYSENHEEFHLQGIDEVCHNINSYEQFELLCDEILCGSRTIDKAKYDRFINNHLTSTWLNELMIKVTNNQI